MFDFAWSEFALIGIVALLVIGPKDMPVAIRTVTGLIKKGRRLAGEFQSHVDEMVREADLGEARDQFRQLRSLDVRNKILKTIDGDGSLAATFRENPLAANPPAGPRGLDVTSKIVPAPHPDAAETLASAVAPAAADGPAVAALSSSVSDEVAADDAVPRILPPPVGQRLRAERARPPAPRILPPTAVRPLGDEGWRPSWRQ
ncbi:Sec-independent protein translocase protein TatB [Rhizosaccharibacter radicis]|uniref:Sec-independent protein translocase protein TatB n=1 Tax=Rhizosaccharibacter radicis TaxID=2782605 RepID=A0ABT1VW71_9PROT|nr:Sec-independent protein translocase protein TatB [Acetobacteraceae bacterium KSS12]